MDFCVCDAGRSICITFRLICYMSIKCVLGSGRLHVKRIDCEIHDKIACSFCATTKDYFFPAKERILFLSNHFERVSQGFGEIFEVESEVKRETESLTLTIMRSIATLSNCIKRNVTQLFNLQKLIFWSNEIRVEQRETSLKGNFSGLVLSEGFINVSSLTCCRCGPLGIGNSMLLDKFCLRLQFESWM